MNREHTENKEVSVISVLLFRYLPYWPLFVFLLVLAIAAAWVYIQTTTPLYQSSTSILLKDDKRGVNNGGVEDELNIASASKIVDNEIEVLKSAKLMSGIVTALHLYAPTYEVEKFRVRSAYLTSPIAIIAKKPEDLKPTGNISFFMRGNNAVVVDNVSYPLNQWVNTPYGELQFIKNPNKTADAIHPLVFRIAKIRNVAYSFTSQMLVSPMSKSSTVVSVSLKDEVPERGETVLNKLAEEYNRFSIDEKNKIALTTLAFVDARLASVERELDSLEGTIQNYRTRKGVVNLSDQSRLFLQNVGEYDRKASDVNLKLSVLSEVEKYVTSKSGGTGIVPSTVGVEDPALSALVQRLYATELEYEKLRKTTGDKNPMVIPLAQEIAQIRPQILESIRNQRNSLAASKANLTANSSVFSSMLNTVPQKERELTEISRQQAIKSNVYSFLLQKREQTALAVSSTVSDGKVLDTAVSSGKPVSPKIPFIYLAAIFAALIIGAGFISAKEVLNRKILFRSEIESFTALPVVAEISTVKKKQSLLDNNSKVSLVAEQFRQLRAAIGLYGKHAHDKKLLVTSSISGEGKSYISTNLAMSLALSGKKVVLIDLDVRNPKVSYMLGVKDKPGIAEFLTGSKSKEEIINSTSYPNLFVIGAGENAEHVRELILEGRLNDLLLQIENGFDYIVMDTSPIEPVSDAYVLGRYCDRTLFVVRHGYTPKNMVQLFDENSKIQGLKNPVIVFNDVHSRGFLNRTNGYGYGYGYASVYRERTRKEDKKSLEL